MTVGFTGLVSDARHIERSPALESGVWHIKGCPGSYHGIRRKMLMELTAMFLAMSNEF